MKIKTEFDIDNDVFYDYGIGAIKGNIFEVRVIAKIDGVYKIAYVIEPDVRKSPSDDVDVIEEELVAKTKEGLRVKVKRNQIKKIEKQKQILDKKLKNLMEVNY